MSDMNYFIARMLIEERMSEANQQRVAREAQRRERPPAATPARKARRRSRLWGLVRVRQAHS